MLLIYASGAQGQNGEELAWTMVLGLMTLFLINDFIFINSLSCVQFGTKLEEEISDYMSNLFEASTVVSIIRTLVQVYIIIMWL